MRELRLDNSIVIFPADKRSATVVMNTEDYKRKVVELLYPGTYKQLRMDPTVMVIKGPVFSLNNHPWRLI